MRHVTEGEYYYYCFDYGKHWLWSVYNDNGQLRVLEQIFHLSPNERALAKGRYKKLPTQTLQQKDSATKQTEYQRLWSKQSVCQ